MTRVKCLTRRHQDKKVIIETNKSKTINANLCASTLGLSTGILRNDE